MGNFYQSVPTANTNKQNMAAEASSPTTSSTGSGSQTPLPMPPSLAIEDISDDFPNCKHSFTAVIHNAFHNPIRDNTKAGRKRTRLSMHHFIDPVHNSHNYKPITAYLCDQWADLLQLFWPLNAEGHIIGKENDLRKIQISITFYGVRTTQIPDEDMDPNRNGNNANIAFLVDRDTPQSDDVWIEFKTCCNRICGRNGLRFTKQRMIAHVTGTDKIKIAGNCNSEFLSPSYPYMPLQEVRPFPIGMSERTAKGCVYGYVSQSEPPKHTRPGAPDAYSMKICMKDATVDPREEVSEGFHVMIFGNRIEKFPGVQVGDIIRFHRLHMNYRPPKESFPGYFQGVFSLSKCPKKLGNSFIVIDGNRTLPINKESVKQTSHENCTFDEASDGHIIKYLREYVHFLRTNQNAQNTGEHTPTLIDGVTDADPLANHEVVYLNEIEDRHERVNAVVMIVGKVDIDNSNDNDEEDINMSDESDDTLEFYWRIWDGSYCKDNRDILSFSLQNDDEKNGKDDTDRKMDVDADGNGDDDGKQDVDQSTMDQDQDQDDNQLSTKWEVDCLYHDERVIGSRVRVLVAPEYETAVLCETDIAVGSWVRLSGILVDHQKKQLVYDDLSQIQTIDAMNVRSNKFIEQRMKLVYHQIHTQTNVVTTISSIVPHHQYQSFTPIRSVINCKVVDCRYLIKGKCTKYYPLDLKQFSRKCKDGSGFWMFFVLFIKDASDGEIPVIFTGTEAEHFLGMGMIGDLSGSDSESESESKCEQLVEIQKCIEMIMNEKSILDVCIRSYQPKGRPLIAYKAMDTKLVER